MGFRDIVKKAVAHRAHRVPLRWLIEEGFRKMTQQFDTVNALLEELNTTTNATAERPWPRAPSRGSGPRSTTRSSCSGRPG
jgi:hypothetical protein